MKPHSLLFPLLLGTLAASAPLKAQSPAPGADPQKSLIAIRRQRVDLLRDELKQSAARIGSRLDAVVETLTMVTDSKDSRTKVARMKEETGKRLMNLINYCNQKRAALKEELRSPRLRLSNEEKRTLIAAFDTRIETNVQRILALYQSMPSHKEYERYKATPGGWWGTQYERNEEYGQNKKMTAHTNVQRDAILKQLDASIARLTRQSRDLNSQLGAVSDPAQRKALADDISRTEALITERRNQRLELAKPTTGAPHTIALKQAMDMDKELQTAANDLRRDITDLFGKYNTYLSELSALHTAEASAGIAPR